MDQLVKLEKYLEDLIKFQDNDMAKLTATLILQKVHRLMDEYMKGIEKEQAYYTGYEDGAQAERKGVSNNE